MILLYLAGALSIGILTFLNRNRNLGRVLIGLFILLQWFFTIHSLLHRNTYQFSFFLPDALAIITLLVLSIISIPALLHSYDYIYGEHDSPRTRGMYYGAMMILIMALTAAYLSSHIAVTWIFIEITTLSASTLIFHRRKAGSVEATWKYIFVCSVSLTLVFIGILFLSIALGNVNETSLQYARLTELAPKLDTFWLKLSFVFIFTGYTAKLGLVPMFTAGIDAKDKAPTPCAALFSSVLLNVGFVGIFRFYSIVAHTSVHPWANYIIMAAALLSVFVATVYMFKLKNIKRMLAYSSIEHMGVLMIGLAAGGIGYYAAILHLVLHSFVKSSMFLQIGHLYKTYRSKEINEIGNYFQYNTAGGLFLLISFIAITAMPPSGLFVSELYIFKALLNGGYLYILIPMLILITMIIWAMGSGIFRMLFVPAGEKGKTEPVNHIETGMQYLLLAIIFYLGLNPPAGFVALINEAISGLMV